MIVGIGTDLLHVPRIKALIAKRGAPTLARRILSPRELTEFKALIRGKLNLPSSSSASTSTSTSKAGTGAGAGAGAGTGVKGAANGDNAERTSFRTVLKGLNRNIENEEVTRFLASRWAAKEAAYKALYPLYVTAQGSSSSSSNGNNPTTTSSATTATTTFTSSSSLKPYTSLPFSPSFPSPSSSSSSSSSSANPSHSGGDNTTRLSPNLTWKSVDLHYTHSKPYLRYTYGYGTTHDLERDSDVRKLRMPRLHVSLSHDGEYVSAVVVAEEEGDGGGGSGEGRGGGKKEGKGGTVLREYR